MNNITKNYFKDLAASMERLVIYRGLLKDNIIKEVYEIFLCASDESNSGAGLRSRYFELVSKLIVEAEKQGISGEIYKKYIAAAVLKDDNLFSNNSSRNWDMSHEMYRALLSDIAILKKILFADFGAIKSAAGDSEGFLYMPDNRRDNETIAQLKEKFEHKTSEDVADFLINFHKGNGYGKFIENIFLKWEHGTIKGVKDHDTITLDDIFCYDYQKDILIKNTEALLHGFPTNNILLAGARGTGKSSCVKALGNKYGTKNLRIIEVSKNEVETLGGLIEILRNSRMKFIIFIDDLSFEEFETGYKHLKSLLEGGIEKRPSNVAVYVTSNRRHIVRENWKDRENEDMHESDSTNEKLSLSDRFGITLTFGTPNWNEFNAIVEGIASKENIALDREKLKKEAVKWEMSNNARSGRTARQFIDYIKGVGEYK